MKWNLWLIGIIFATPLATTGCSEFFRNLEYNRECEGHLRRAADAQTIQLAKSELEKARDYCIRTGRDKGSSHLVYATPDNDVGYWFNNYICKSIDELTRAEQDGTLNQLGESNILMKLRETLTSKGQSGENITQPTGIVLFPHNRAYVVWYTLSILLSIIGSIIIGFCVANGR